MRYRLLLLAFALTIALPACVRAITFGDWIATYGLTGGNATASADPDGDSIPNLMEYALDGCNPTLAAGDTTRLPTYTYARWLGTPPTLSYLPASSSPTPPSDGIGGIYYASLAYKPRPNVEGITYDVQLSHELSRWYSGRSAIFVQMVTGNQVQATTLSQQNNRPRLFMRLSVSASSGTPDLLSGLGVFGLVEQALIIGTPTVVQRTLPGTGGTTATITDRDRMISRTTGAISVTDYDWSWAPGPANLGGVSVTRSSSNPAVIIPDPASNTRWTYMGNGTATLTMSTAGTTYSATVTTSQSTPATVDTVIGYASTSLAAHIVAQVDPLLVGKTPATALPLFTPAGSRTRNASCWAAAYTAALTSWSPWNSSDGGGMGGVLISPRHVLFCTHWAPGAGTTLVFVAADGTQHSRTLTAVSSLPGYVPYYPDLSVGVLNSDLPGTIAFARVLPDNWSTKLPSISSTDLRIPAVRSNQWEDIVVADLASITSSAGANGATVGFAVPRSAPRSTFYKDWVLYDSGSPACLLINSQLVVLTTATSGGAGSGTFVSYHRAAINTLMTSLGGGYQLTDADLSSFPSY